MEYLYREGLLLITYCSERNQIDKGENKFGMEIKYDDRFKKTGNLYLEIAEKRRAENVEWIPSGICRSDNSWLYAIGNYEILFIFPKAYLLGICETEKFFLATIDTSKGYLMPRSAADKYAIRKVPIGREEPIVAVRLIPVQGRLW